MRGKSRFLTSLGNRVKLSLLPACSRVILHVPRRDFQVRGDVLLASGPGGGNLEGCGDLLRASQGHKPEGHV